MVRRAKSKQSKSDARRANEIKRAEDARSRRAQANAQKMHDISEAFEEGDFPFKTVTIKCPESINNMFNDIELFIDYIDAKHNREYILDGIETVRILHTNPDTTGISTAIRTFDRKYDIVFEGDRTVIFWKPFADFPNLTCKKRSQSTCTSPCKWVSGKTRSFCRSAKNFTDEPRTPKTKKGCAANPQSTCTSPCKWASGTKRSFCRSEKNKSK
jgi:hypothetical protein